MKRLLAGFTSHFYDNENEPHFKKTFHFPIKNYDSIILKGINIFVYRVLEIMLVILCKETVKLRNNIRIKA